MKHSVLIFLLAAVAVLSVSNLLWTMGNTELRPAAVSAAISFGVLCGFIFGLALGADHCIHSENHNEIIVASTIVLALGSLIGYYNGVAAMAAMLVTSLVTGAISFPVGIMANRLFSPQHN